MKEGIRNVELLCRLVARRGDGKNSMNCGRFDQWSECFAKINSSALSESPHHPAGLVSLQRSIGIQFMFEYPFVSDDVGAWGPIDETPGSVALECVILKSHGGAPMGIFESGASGGRNGGNGRGGCGLLAGQCVSWVGFENPRPGVRLHMVNGCRGIEHRLGRWNGRRRGGVR